MWAGLDGRNGIADAGDGKAGDGLGANGGRMEKNAAQQQPDGGPARQTAEHGGPGIFPQ